MQEKIKEYWQDRAKQHAAAPAATTDDVYLRELEIATLRMTLGEHGLTSGTFLDVGCGDGYSTMQIAAAFPGFTFWGVDYSENMIANAKARLNSHPELSNRVKFSVGDVLSLCSALEGTVFDIALTDRCLINLETFANQASALAQIAACVKPKGLYIAIENFAEGQDNLNQARAAVGLPEIPVRWHNIYFKEEEFLSCVREHFDLPVIKDFSSSYYFATRVVYSKMCQMRGEAPDYKHEIHQLAVQLPWTGQFSPVRMAVLTKRA